MRYVIKFALIDVLSSTDENSFDLDTMDIVLYKCINISREIYTFWGGEPKSVSRICQFPLVGHVLRGSSYQA
jgi:hypothetical protein